METILEKLPVLVEKTLQGLAEGLNVTVEYIIPILIKQVYVEGVTEVLFLVLSILGIFFAIYLAKKSYNSEIEDVQVICGILCVVVFAVSIIMLGVRIANIKETITAFVNPEYRMIEMILEKVGEIKQ